MTGGSRGDPTNHSRVIGGKMAGPSCALLHFPARWGLKGGCRLGLISPAGALLGSAYFRTWKHITPRWDASAGRGCATSHHPRPDDRGKQTTFRPRCEKYRDGEPHASDGNRTCIVWTQCILGLGSAACHLILSHHHTTSTLKNTRRTYFSDHPSHGQSRVNTHFQTRSILCFTLTSSHSYNQYASHTTNVSTSCPLGTQLPAEAGKEPHVTSCRGPPHFDSARGHGKPRSLPLI